MAEQDVENELLDYDEDEEPQAPQESTPAPPKKDVKGSYVSIHSSGFRDFLLKPELLRAIVDCGFEHPSEGMLPGVATPPSPAMTFPGRGVYREAASCLLLIYFFLPQSSMSVFPRPFWVWMSCARPSLGWARQLCLCWPPCSRSSPSMAR